MKIELSPNRRTEQFVPKENENIGFGTLRTDHMFLAEYKDGKWQNQRIIPYQNLSLAPGAMVLHYGQECFEGVKAFQRSDGELQIGRLEDNAKRMQYSAEKLSIPPVPTELFCDAVNTLVDVDRLWFPKQDSATFYIRPFVFGTSDKIALGPSEEYLFCVIISPSGKYFSIDKPLKLLITEKFHRVAPGSTGDAKAGGNYAASLQAQKYAVENGANQVLFLDCSNTYLEEVGAMNHFHVRNGELIIPQFTDTILKSITALSMIKLAKHLNIPVKQERIKVSEFIEDIKSGIITECGGFGTAASISPVGEYLIDETGETITVGDGQTGPITQKLYDTYTKMQRGEIEDPFGWFKVVERNQ